MAGRKKSGLVWRCEMTVYINTAPAIYGEVILSEMALHQKRPGSAGDVILRQMGF